jgi:hypothetical protein
MEILMILSGFYQEKQSQFIRSECCVLSTARTKLKKQSQFAGGLN